jgi:outer membrane protein W
MKSAIIVSLLAIGPACGFAQSNFMISYPIGFPVGDLHNYISNTSFRGINLEFNKQVAPNQSVGLELGWNTFYQHVNQKVYTEGTQSISGVQYRYTNTCPMVAGGKFYMGEHKGKTHPYIGVGLGTLYANRTTDFGIYRITTDTWQFLIRPEAGFEMNAGSSESFFIGVKYYWAFNTDALVGQNYLTANIGFKFTGL